jgi:putrescine transport system ATP-binding protein
LPAYLFDELPAYFPSGIPNNLTPTIMTMPVSSAAPQETPQVALVIRNLVKDFDGVKAVNDVSISINKGEIFALLGSSGCGKSTLLRLLAGFETPTSGEISLNGQSMVNVPPYQRPINMMFQSYALFPHLSVWENIAFGLRRDGMPKADIAARVDKMLTMVQLKPYAQRKPHQLSGGQQQRVALARSLAQRPQLLLLDEPLGALDKKLREQTQLELVNIIEQVGVTCVMVTHDQEEAMSMATRLAIMSEGRILQIGTPHEVYETPNCRFVADFIGNISMFHGTVTEDEVDHVVINTPECQLYIGHGITGTVGMAASVGIRPEKVLLSFNLPEGPEGQGGGGGGGGNGPTNFVHGEVVELAYLGGHTLYHVKLATGMILKAMATNSARHGSDQPKWGDQVYAHWSKSDAVVLTQ